MIAVPAPSWPCRIGDEPNSSQTRLCGSRHDLRHPAVGDITVSAQVKLWLRDKPRSHDHTRTQSRVVNALAIPLRNAFPIDGQLHILAFDRVGA